MSISVVIGRFQVPDLHQGHRSLLKTAQEASDGRWVVLIGVSDDLGSKRNPLDFKTRQIMIKDSQYIDRQPKVLPLPDLPTDEEWSKNVDLTLESLYPNGDFKLYGSRDSFANHYSGKYPIVDVKQVGDYSGTKLRENAAKHPQSNSQFRAGVIYAAYYNRNS